MSQGMTETKDPRTLVTASGWCYQILPQGADRSCNYSVSVYYLGRKVATSYADTKWGARKQARALQRRYYRRQRLTAETRAMKDAQ